MVAYIIHAYVLDSNYCYSHVCILSSCIVDDYKGPTAEQGLWPISDLADTELILPTIDFVELLADVHLSTANYYPQPVEQADTGLCPIQNYMYS